MANSDAAEERGRARTEAGGPRSLTRIRVDVAERGDGHVEGQAEKDALEDTPDNGVGGCGPRPRKPAVLERSRHSLHLQVPDLEKIGA